MRPSLLIGVIFKKLHVRENVVCAFNNNPTSVSHSVACYQTAPNQI